MKEQLYRLAGEYLLDSETKERRATLRERVLFWLGVGCLVALVVISTRAYAENIPLHVLDKNGVEIRLMDLPCVDGLSIALIRPDALHRFKAIESVWPEKDGTRKKYAGCWAELSKQEAGEEGFLLVFEDGASGFIPKDEFKKVKGQSGA